MPFRGTEGQGPFLPVQSEPASNHAPPRPSVTASRPRTPESPQDSCQVGRLPAPPEQPLPPTPQGPSEATLAGCPRSRDSPYPTWLCPENSLGFTLAAKSQDRAGWGEGASWEPGIPGSSHGGVTCLPRGGARVLPGGYLVESCELQPEAQLGHGGRVPGWWRERLPHDRGRSPRPQPGSQPGCICMLV